MLSATVHLVVTPSTLSLMVVQRHSADSASVRPSRRAQHLPREGAAPTSRPTSPRKSKQAPSLRVSHGQNGLGGAVLGGKYGVGVFGLGVSGLHGEVGAERVQQTRARRSTASLVVSMAFFFPLPGDLFLLASASVAPRYKPREREREDVGSCVGR
ncbi:unnamed protein product [Musa acuminata var. zebrina]